MNGIARISSVAVVLQAASLLISSQVGAGSTDNSLSGRQALTSETPRTFTPSTESFDYIQRDVMIAMRDGVKLHTLILIPRDARRAPILLTRTPYGAASRTNTNPSAHLASVLDDEDVAMTPCCTAATSASSRTFAANTDRRETTGGSIFELIDDAAPRRAQIGRWNNR